MTWIAPITVATNDILSAAQYNVSVRDNLLETAPAKATGSGNMFSVSANNQIGERDVNSSYLDVSEQTVSTSYADLDTTGPSVTVDCAVAIVLFSARMRNVNGDGKGAYASVAGSGSTVFSASDAIGISVSGIAANNPMRIGGQFAVALTPGSNTFTMKYRCQVGYAPCQFEQRELVVIPL